MNARHVLLGISFLQLAVSSGCTNCCRPAAAPAVNVGVGIPAVPPPSPVPFTGVPSPAPVPQPPQPQPLPPAPPPPPAASNFGPPQTAEWQDTWRPAPSQPIVRLSTPEPLLPNEEKPRPALYPPEVSGQSQQPPPATGNPLPRDDRPSSLPAGIPQFAVARDKVTTGLKPLLDGLDWLQANGYRTVLKVRRPGEDDSAERRQVEKRGLKFLVLEVSPQTLSRQTVDEFGRVVTDAKGQPLFVYDRDGALAGGLWYLYYRMAERASDEVARVRASALGLRDDQDGSHREMWLAIQKLVSETR